MTDTAAAASPRTLIFVHGRGSKPRPDLLLELVIAALETGIGRDYPESMEAFRAVEKRLAYYATHTNALLEAQGEHYDEALDLGDSRNALQQLKTYDRRKKFSLANYDRLPGKSAVPELAAGVAGPLLRTVGLSKRLAGKVLPELRAYWARERDFADAVQSAVRDAIAGALSAGEQLLLVTHGTGSIIAWDVLWQLSHEPAYADLAGRKVDTWLTLGAPLGDNMVRRNLAGAKEKGRQRYPVNVVTWHNLSAEDDWLCHDNTLADDFRGMLQQRQVSAIRDYRVYNLAVRYGRSDPHCALGYLVHPRVAQIVADWLQREPLPV